MTPRQRGGGGVLVTATRGSEHAATPQPLHPPRAFASVSPLVAAAELAGAAAPAKRRGEVELPATPAATLRSSRDSAALASSIGGTPPPGLMDLEMAGGMLRLQEDGDEGGAPRAAVAGGRSADESTPQESWQPGNTLRGRSYGIQQSPVRPYSSRMAAASSRVVAHPPVSPQADSARGRVLHPSSGASGVVAARVTAPALFRPPSSLAVFAARDIAEELLVSPQRLREPQAATGLQQYPVVVAPRLPCAPVDSATGAAATVPPDSVILVAVGAQTRTRGGLAPMPEQLLRGLNEAGAVTESDPNCSSLLPPAPVRQSATASATVGLSHRGIDDAPPSPRSTVMSTPRSSTRPRLTAAAAQQRYPGGGDGISATLSPPFPQLESPPTPPSPQGRLGMLAGVGGVTSSATLGSASAPTMSTAAAQLSSNSTTGPSQPPTSDPATAADSSDSPLALSPHRRAVAAADATCATGFMNDDVGSTPAPLARTFPPSTSMTSPRGAWAVSALGNPWYAAPGLTTLAAMQLRAQMQLHQPPPPPVTVESPEGVDDALNPFSKLVRATSAAPPSRGVAGRSFVRAALLAEERFSSTMIAGDHRALSALPGPDRGGSGAPVARPLATSPLALPESLPKRLHQQQQQHTPSSAKGEDAVKDGEGGGSVAVFVSPQQRTVKGVDSPEWYLRPPTLYSLPLPAVDNAAAALLQPPPRALDQSQRPTTSLASALGTTDRVPVLHVAPRGAPATLVRVGTAPSGFRIGPGPGSATAAAMAAQHCQKLVPPLLERLSSSGALRDCGGGTAAAVAGFQIGGGPASEPFLPSS